MSFGFSASDIVTISTLAWKTYKTCKGSSDEFKRIASEVASLHCVLKETEELLDEDSGLSPSRRARLTVILETSSEVLSDLSGQLTKYESLGTHSQRTWDRLRWGLEDVSDVRSRLISVCTMLAAFNSSLANSSQARVEKRLEKFIAEVRAGMREGSVVSSSHSQNLDNSDAWDDLRRELADVGISPLMVSEHQEYIKTWFKEAIAAGLLQTVDDGTCARQDSGVQDQETQPPSSVSTKPSASSSNQLSASATLVESPRMIQSDEPFDKPDLLRRRTTAQDIDALLSRDEPPFPSLPPPNRSDTSQSHSPAVLLRKYSFPSRLFFRAFTTDLRLVQAASDGSLTRVATLISRGANVNVKDRWGWTALAMAAYGGHETIAKLLLACGAEIETVDVDGDSPLDLATNRGHTDVVIAMEEERANRVIAAGKADPALTAATAAAASPPRGGQTKSADDSSKGDVHWEASRWEAPRWGAPYRSQLRRWDTEVSPSRRASEFGPLRRAETGLKALTGGARTEYFGPLKKRPTFKTRDTT